MRFYVISVSFSFPLLYVSAVLLCDSIVLVMYL